MSQQTAMTDIIPVYWLKQHKYSREADAKWKCRVVSCRVGTRPVADCVFDYGAPIGSKSTGCVTLFCTSLLSRMCGSAMVIMFQFLCS